MKIITINYENILCVAVIIIKCHCLNQIKNSEERVHSRDPELDHTLQELVFYLYQTLYHMSSCDILLIIYLFFVAVICYHVSSNL